MDPLLDIDDQSFTLQLEEIEGQPEFESLFKWTGYDTPGCIANAVDSDSDSDSDSYPNSDSEDEDGRWPPPHKVECIVCRDSFDPPSAVRLECKDIYCKPCLKSFVLRVSEDESLFPPRCHDRPIDISTIEADFSSEEMTAYQAAEMEFTSAGRVYCADPKCAKFIPVSQREPDRASCSACRARTCMRCRALAHHGACAVDEVKQRLMNYADRKGWRPCFRCGEMVSRHGGCNHMTCRCRAQFCYKCGVQWKKCRCDDYDRAQVRPLEPAARHPERQPEPTARQQEAAARQERLRALRAELQTAHVCSHNGEFRRIERPRLNMICRLCNLYSYRIYSCEVCFMLVCRQCQIHRVPLPGSSSILPRR